MNTNTAPAAPAVPATPASTEVTSAEVVKELTKLEPNAKPAEILAKINELVDRVNTKRDRGPDSTRNMTEADARNIMLGDLKDISHTKAAKVLGLSYGQVYSARKGFTYKSIYKEMEAANRKAEAAKKS